MTKDEFRRQAKQNVKVLSAEVRAKEAEEMCHRIECHPQFVNAEVILAFHPLPDEIDIKPILEKHGKKKTILLPVVKGETLILKQFFDKQLKKGTFGIEEPTGDVFKALGDIGLIIIPGVAFDGVGHRLGRGRGYYDRLLATPSLSNAFKLGVGFSVQKFDILPTEPHDITMDEVL